jgi:hypothetical protein
MFICFNVNSFIIVDISIYNCFCSCREVCKRTAMSFPVFSGRFPNFIAAAAAAPDEIPT